MRNEERRRGRATRVVGRRAGAARLLVLAALVALSSAAWGQEGGEAAPAAHVAALVGRGLHGDAMHACDDALPAGAADGSLQLLCGGVYVALYRLDDGERCGLAALELLPTDPAPLLLLADSFSRRGDDEVARGYAERALALAPDDPATQALVRTLAGRAARRTVPPEPEVTSPAHVVWTIVEAARAGRLDAALPGAVDAEALLAARRSAHLLIRGDAAAETRRFVDALVARLREGGGALAGYAFAPGAASTGDEAQVAVELAAERRPDMADVERLARRFEAPPAPGELPLPGGEVYRSLAEADRLPYLRRRANVAEPVAQRLVFTLRRRAGAWRVVDFSAGERSLTAILRELDGLPAEVAPDPAREAHPTTLTTLVALAAGLGFVIYMLRRRLR